MRLFQDPVALSGVQRLTRYALGWLLKMLSMDSNSLPPHELAGEIHVMKK